MIRYDKDDGQEITEPVFSADGNWIAYARGGPPNSEKDIPNPTSDPAGAKQEVWLVNVRNGSPARVGEGSSPMFSPRGDRGDLRPRRSPMGRNPARGKGARNRPGKKDSRRRRFFFVVVRRLPDGDGAYEGFGPVCCRGRYSRSPRLEHASRGRAVGYA